MEITPLSDDQRDHVEKRELNRAQERMNTPSPEERYEEETQRAKEEFKKGAKQGHEGKQVERKVQTVPKPNYSTSPTNPIEHDIHRIAQMIDERIPPQPPYKNPWLLESLLWMGGTTLVMGLLLVVLALVGGIAALAVVVVIVYFLISHAKQQERTGLEQELRRQGHSDSETKRLLKELGFKD